MKTPARLGLLLSSVSALALAPAAHAVQIYYQAGFTANIYVFDSVAGTNTLLGATGGPNDSFGMAFSPGGTLYAHDRGTASLYTVNTGTGAATLVGATGIGAEDLTFNLAGTAAYASAGGNLYSINPASGNASLLGSLGTTMDGLTTAPIAVNVNGTNYAAGSVFGIDSGSLYAINVATQTATFIGSVNADETLEFGADGTLYGHDSGTFYAINTMTLAGTAIGNSGNVSNIFGMAIGPGNNNNNRVPESGSALLLFTLSGAGLLFLRRRFGAR